MRESRSLARDRGSDEVGFRRECQGFETADVHEDGPGALDAGAEHLRNESGRVIEVGVVRRSPLCAAVDGYRDVGRSEIGGVVAVEGEALVVVHGSVPPAAGGGAAGAESAPVTWMGWELESAGLMTAAAITAATSLWAIVTACWVLFGPRHRRRR